MNIKLTSSIGLIIGAILLGGCAQPTFNPNNKGIIFASGKPYMIPVQAAHFSLDNEYRTTSQLGLCKKSGILWVETNTARQAGFLMNGSDESALLRRSKETMKMAKKTGTAGCVYPLSNQEYQYRMLEKQQKYGAEQASKARAQESFDRTLDRSQRHNEAMLNSMRPQIVLPNVYSY